MTDTPSGDSILSGLRAAEPSARIAAIEQLAALPESAAQTAFTEDLLAALEALALRDPVLAVRLAALQALSAPAAQSRRAAHLPLDIRLEILTGIDRWLLHGMLDSRQADVLRRRYNFDLPPLRISPEARAALAAELETWERQGLLDPRQAADLRRSLHPAGAPGQQPAAERPAAEERQRAQQQAAQGQPAAERLPAAEGQPAAEERGSALQVLFSEVSIRIALYLGGFLIVAAMLILAALVEVARLPILLGMTAASAAGAALLFRRLPLPAFVIFLVFACLLPIDARILIEQSGAARTAGYWVLAWALVAAVFWWGTWLFRSRLFSLLALGALTACGWMLAVWQGERAELALFYTLLAALAGLAGSGLLRRLGERTAAPLFWTAQAAALLTVLVELIFTAGVSLEPPDRSPWWGISAAWLAAAVFYGYSDRRLKPLMVFPFMAAGSLVLLAWSALAALDLPHLWRVIGLAGAGLAFTAAAERLDNPARRAAYAARYRCPLWGGALILLGWAALAGLDWSGRPFLIDWPWGNWPAFAVLALTAAVYGALHARRRRPALWFAALTAGLLAYLVFFHLPFARGWRVDLAYRLLIAGLALLLPDLLRGPRREAGRDWTLLARHYGAAVSGVNTLIILFAAALHALARLFEPGAALEELDWAAYALTYTLLGLVCLGFALRWRRPWPVYGLAGYAGMGLAFWLLHLGWSAWALPLAGLAAAFYGAGHLPAVRNGEPGWTAALRRSGLALGAAVVLRMPFEAGAQPGFALLAAGVLFLVELLAARNWRLEWPLYLLAAGGYLRLLAVYLPGVSYTSYGLLGAALIVLGFDLFFHWRWRAERQKQLLAAVTGGLIVLAHALFLAVQAGPAENMPPAEAAWIYLFYAGFFLLAVWVYRAALLGAAPLGFLALALIFALHSDYWAAPLVGLGGLYYLLSYLWRRFRPPEGWAAGWIGVLRAGGLALAGLAAVTAPLEQRLVASIPVAAAATLWALDAFRRRNVWLGFPANGLYLLAYFIILLELRVDQPQYYSTGVALLGLVMHILLVRSGGAPGASLGAFVTGMVSQLALLGTTYIQMVSTEELGYFVMLFFQGLLVLGYGVAIRSRSLVFTPLVFIVLGVVTVVLSVLSGVPTAIIIGCTGFFLLAAGIAAVAMRDHLLRAEDRMGGWRA